MSQANGITEKIDEITQEIALDPQNVDLNANLYLQRASLHLEEGKFLEAVNDCTQALQLNPNDAIAYQLRGLCHKQISKYDEAIQDYTKSLEINPKEIFAYFDRGLCYTLTEQYTKAKDDFSEVIKLDPEKAKAYYYRGLCKNTENHHADAINDFTKAIEFEPKDAESYSSRGDCYYKIKKYREAIKDFTKSLKLNPDNEEAIATQGDCYHAVGNYEKAHDCYEKYIDISMTFEINDETAENLVNIADYYCSKRKYEQAFLLYEQVMGLNPEVASNELLLQKTKDIYESQKADLNEAHKNKMLEMQLKQQEKIADAREKERNKIMADLSHHIKNLISTVIDPLENLQEENSVKPQVIQNALRGANLVREIVNAMNLSFKGSIQDFFYDAKHNKTKDATALESIITESLKHSISNMFDGKYFGNFVRKYFPSKAIFVEAKSQWTRLSQSDELQELTPFLKKYFFEIDIAIDQAEKFMLGNEKGSAMKLLILFQELILNAVKYSAFVDEEKRFIRITFTHNAKHISIKVENRFKANVKTKTSGIGHVIIENFAKLLNTHPNVKKNGDIYSVEIQFVNFWEAPTE